VVRALEDRPVTVDTLAGRVGEVLNLVAPRGSDALFSRFDRLFPDSGAARGGAKKYSGDSGVRRARESR
jgi:hypothetical protein